MNLLTQLSKYFFIFLILIYTLEAYLVLVCKTKERKGRILRRQIVVMYIMTGFGFYLIWFNTGNILVLLLYGGIFVYFTMTLLCYRLLYPSSSMLLLNNMLMLLGIGFIVIARLDLEQAAKQFVIAAGATVVAFIIPVIIRRLKFLENLTWLYAVLGIAALAVVFVLATVSGGAKLSISVAGITIQFSELVKITLVFFLACRLSKNTSRWSVALTSAVAAAHVGILVLSTDLGTALVFFVAYLVMVFAGTKNAKWPLAGLAAGSLAAVAAYHLFSHVKKRVTVWRDPFADYEHAGYQIVQSLFAIGAGGWFGTGLCQGSPNTIPVASKDFIFAAICEEFGAVFAICLILICMSMFLLIVNISMQIHNRFYQLVALGLGTEYAFQVFLTIGGVTNFIPMTGITLPLVSYGGSSVFSTIVMLAIVEGMYILAEDEGVRSGRHI